jgi:hypothetical protein
MAAHYKKYKECVRFKTKYPQNIDLIQALLGDRLADGRGAASIDYICNEDDDFGAGSGESSEGVNALSRRGVLFRRHEV